MASILRDGEPRYLADKFASCQLEQPGSKRCSPLDLEARSGRAPNYVFVLVYVRFKQALLNYVLSINK